MTLLVKSFLIHFVAFGVMDALWWGYLMKGFFLKEMGHIGKITNGQPDLNLKAGLVVYFVMSLGLSVFVIKNASVDSGFKALGYGALLGLCLFVTYEFTNLAIIAKYPIRFVLVDSLWGTFMCAVISMLSFKILKGG